MNTSINQIKCNLPAAIMPHSKWYCIQQKCIHVRTPLNIIISQQKGAYSLIRLKLMILSVYIKRICKHLVNIVTIHCLNICIYIVNASLIMISLNSIANKSDYVVWMKRASLSFLCNVKMYHHIIMNITSECQHILINASEIVSGFQNTWSGIRKLSRWATKHESFKVLEI